MLVISYFVSIQVAEETDAGETETGDEAITKLAEETTEYRIVLYCIVFVARTEP